MVVEAMFLQKWMRRDPREAGYLILVFLSVLFPSVRMKRMREQVVVLLRQVGEWDRNVWLEEASIVVLEEATWVAGIARMAQRLPHLHRMAGMAEELV